MNVTPSSGADKGKNNSNANGNLQAALDYLRHGFSVIPIRPSTKKPACSWKQYQSTAADEKRVRQWFHSQSHGLAIVCGAVSGNLCVRDFDDVAAYEKWTTAYPELAKALPTAATHRGRHVYARCQGPQETRTFTDGELRGEGAYVVAPPTLHPKGSQYQWIIPPDGPLTVVDLEKAGFLKIWNVTERTETTENTEAIFSVDSVDSVNSVHSVFSVFSVLSVTSTVHEEVERAIQETLPQSIGQRNRLLFEFARALKSIPPLADADPRDLEAYLRRWHELAEPIIGTKPFDETRIDFLRAWKRVKFPKGKEPVRKVFEAARGAGPPAFAATRYEQSELQLLVALCRQLQALAGDGPFYLSCRTAGELLGVPHVTAWRWLYLLERDKVISLVERGSHSKRRATRYRYIAADGRKTTLPGHGPGHRRRD